ncbi:MAG: PAS domain S-box protein [Phormidium sp. GEM2.Bin31]|nr:MAG: PAS domain S-box protein [Phormidium sp. GEM2.Bin31]
MSCPTNAQTNSENQPFQTLFNTIGEGLILLDHQGYCQQINPAACQMLGQSATTLSQRHLNDFKQLGLEGIPPWKTPPNPEPQSGQFRLRRANGKTDQIDYIISPNITPEHHLLDWRLSHPESPPEPSPETQPRNKLDSSCLHINVTPITTEELEVFYRLQKISENIPGVIYQFCLHPDGRCHFPYASGQFRDLYHIVPETLYDDASAVFEVVHPEDLERVQQSILRSGQTLTPWRCDYRIYSPDGKTRWILGQATPQPEPDGTITWYGYLQDITRQKAIEETLRQSEQQLAKLIDNLNDLIFIADRDGTFNYVSHNFELIMGYPKNELLNQPFSQFIHPDDLAICIEVFEKALRGENSRGTEYRVLHKDGNYYWHSGNGSPLTNENGDIVGCLGVGRYVHEKKQAETALRQKEIHLELALQGSQTGTWDWNLKTQEIVFDEKQWKAFLGGCDEPKASRLITQPLSEWQDRIHPDDQAQVNQAILAHLAGETELFSHEYRVRCQNNSYKWMFAQGKVVEWDEAGQPQRFMGIYQDVSQRKANEIALTELSQQLKKAQEVANLGYWSFDLASEKITWSQEVFNIFGITPDQGEPTYAEHLKQYHPEDLPQILEHIEAAHRGISQQYDFRLVRPKGEIRYCHTRLEVEVHNGKATRLFGTVMDITERKQQEVIIQQALSAADTANRAKSQFLANMSHELRTPLNAILGFTDMMSHDPEIPTEQQGYLNIIHQSGEHLLQIINDILEISKIEAGKVELNPVPFNFAQLLQSLEYLFRTQIDKKGINLTIISDTGLPKFIKTDELKLRQTLINLISNGIKFTQKGEVRLQVRPKDLQSQTSPDSSSGSLSIEFTIADTGPGIAPEELSQLFEAFSQTETGKASKQGTGLGLAISRKFIQMMGGDIHVSSTLGAGTVFTFDIQAQPVQLKTTSVSTPPPRIIHLSPETEPPRILIVDDIEESRLLLRSLLRNVGFHIQEARQGEEALNLWETWQPQLILMDLQMPVLDGYEATRQLRQREATDRSGTSYPPRRTPIIALTANLFAQEQQAATFAGCDRLIAKPFSEQELLKTIGTYLNLQYLYENKIVYDRGECAKTSFGESPLEGLAQMPKSWLMELQQYTKLGSDDLIFSLIARSLREDCPAEQSLAERILQLTRNFQFARLNELIDECLKY